MYSLYYTYDLAVSHLLNSVFGSGRRKPDEARDNGPAAAHLLYQGYEHSEAIE